MRTLGKALLIIGFGAIQVGVPVSQASAADVAVTPVKDIRVVQAKRVKIVHRLRAVRDYDGTAVVFRLAPPHLQRAHASPLYESVPMPRAAPRYYLNGQPVLPTNRVLRTYRS